MRHGEGTLTTPDGHYIGQWKHGLKHGFGREDKIINTQTIAENVTSSQMLRKTTFYKSTAEEYKETYEGQFFQGKRHGIGIMERENQVTGELVKYYGRFINGKRHGQALVIEEDPEKAQTAISIKKCQYDNDNMISMQTQNKESIKELVQEYSPVQLVLNDYIERGEEYVDSKFIPGPFIVLDMQDAKTSTLDFQYYDKTLTWLKLNHFLTASAPDVGEICLFSHTTLTTGLSTLQDTLLDPQNDLNANLLSLLGCIASHHSFLQALFSSPSSDTPPSLNLPLNALSVNLFDPLTGLPLQLPIDLSLPFLTQSMQTQPQLAFVKVCHPVKQSLIQLECWPALLYKTLAKLHGGSYLGLMRLSFVQLSQSLFGNEPTLIEEGAEELAKRLSEKDSVMIVGRCLNGVGGWRFREGWQYRVQDAKEVEVDSSLKKEWLFKIQSNISQKGKEAEGNAEMWLRYTDLIKQFTDFKVIKHPDTIFHCYSKANLLLSQTQTYTYAFFEFKLTTDHNLDPFVIKIQQSFLPRTSLNGGTMQDDPLQDPLAAMHGAEPAPLQLIIGRKRVRRGDGSTAYEYADGLGQQKAWKIEKNCMLKAGEYMMMIELESSGVKGSKGGAGHQPVKIGVQVTSSVPSYVYLHKIDISQMVDYQQFYTETMSTLALSKVSKQYIKNNYKLIGKASLNKTSLWMLQYFSDVHATYIHLFSNESGLSEDDPPLSWTQLLSFPRLTNLVAMRFNTLQLQLPPADTPVINAKFNLEVPPGGGHRYLIIRQVRASKDYELTGGKAEVSLSEVEIDEEASDHKTKMRQVGSRQENEEEDELESSGEDERIQ